MDNYIELNRNFYPIKDNEKDFEEAKVMSAFGYGKYISWEELLQKPRVVILAEPGTGKTEELKAVTNRLRSKGAAAFFWRIELLEKVDILHALDIGTSEEFNNWLSGDEEGYFFLDAVDEAHLKEHSTFEIALRRFAEKIIENKDRIKIFVTCRVSDWRPTKDLQLFQRLLPLPQPNNLMKRNKLKEGIQVESDDKTGKDTEREDIIFQLLPLNDHQIELFAKEKGIKNLKIFMEAIERENATMFAERPQDLLDLIEYWNSKICFGPHAEMVEFNIQKKLKENDSDRDTRRPLLLEEALIGAERLAAAITLQKKNLIVLPDKKVDSTRGEVSIDSKEILIDWPSDKIQILLDRPIFDVAIYGTVQFHHRIVREYLTAKWFKRLLEKGKSRKSIEENFFVNRYGQDVVIPSMKPIIAWLSLWDEQIREHVKRIAPEILIEYGDPSSLPLDFRKTFLIGFTEHYAERQHTGISFDRDMLRRLADPQLATTINELLDKFSNHTDISHMLLIMIWQGQVSESVDKALLCAINNKHADIYTTIWAIRAVAAAGTPIQHKFLVDTLMDDISKLNSRILGEICESFFPNMLSVQQLLKIVETVKMSKQDYTNPVEQNLDRIASDLQSDEVTREILQGFYELLKQPPFTSETYCEVSQSYVWLLPIAIKYANRFILKKDNFSLETLILDFFLSIITIHDYRFYSFEREKIDEILDNAKAWPEFRIELFWRAITVIRAKEKEKNNRIIIWGQVSWYIKEFWIPNVDDLNRLFKALEQKPLLDDRLVALSAIFQIYKDTKRQRQLLYRMKQAVEGNLQLEKILNEFLHPKPLTEALKKERRSNRMHIKRAEIRRKQQEAISLKNTQELIKISEEIKNVGNPEKREVWERTIYLYDRIPEKRNSGKLGLSNWQSLINDFNYDVAKNFRDGCIDYWRKYDPFSDEHVIAFLRGTSNTIPWPLIIGLTGLAMESNDESEWVKKISLEEARVAANYSICELNGFPDWFNSLRDALPDIVDNVIINELKLELQNELTNIHSSRILSILTYNAGIRERFKIILVALLSEKEPINDEALEDALSILVRGTIDLSLQEKVTKIICKYFEKTSDEDRKIQWLKYIFNIDGLKGLEILKQLINDFPLIEEKKNFMIKFCAAINNLSEERFEQDIIHDFEKVEILNELVPLICQYVKPEEDVHRTSGVYTPNIRDKAEETRSRLISIIANAPGDFSYNTLVNLSMIGNSSYFKDRMDYLAKNRAALDAEFRPWTGSSIIKFEDISVKNEKHDPQDYIHLLHLSDLHFTEDISPDVKLQWLLQDIRQGNCLGFNNIEYLVISGDFTDKSNEVGFERARQFISRLLSELSISEECCILVPGNHDIEYNKSFKLKSFSELLFNKIINNTYPSETDKQAQSHLFPEDCIQFIELNSGWQIDLSNQKRASINLNSLAYILDKAEKEKQSAINSGILVKNQKFLRIAVFHHPVTQLETMRIQNFIEHLRQSGVQLILHGDIHEINREIYKIWEKTNIHIIGAGSFGKVDDRPNCTPRLYNLLEIKKDLSLIRIHTRQQPIIDGPWEGWFGWPDPNSRDARLPYFKISL